MARRRSRPPPKDPKAPATGTLRFFAYGDTVDDEILDPFREENPDLDLQTASFNSNKAAAAKLAGGFEADVVEVCADEMEPLLIRGLIRPLDPAGVDRLRPPRLLRLRRDPQRGGQGPVRPRVGGAARPDRQHRRGRREPDRLLHRPLRPRLRGARGDGVDPADRDRRRRRWRSGWTTRWTSVPTRSTRSRSTCSTTATSSATSPSPTRRWSTTSSRARW